jgi:hypothetical protein
MKITLLNQLIVNGATQRLNDLNKERELLIKLIEKYSGEKIIRLPKDERAKYQYKKKKHWMQRPENKARVKAQLDKMRKARYAKSK